MSEFPDFTDKDAQNIGDFTELDLLLKTGMDASDKDVEMSIDSDALLDRIFEGARDQQIIDATRQSMEDNGEL